MICTSCSTPMPRDPKGHEIPTEWSVVRIEKHGSKFITIEYHYLCQDCTLTFSSKQTNLPIPQAKVAST